MFVYFFILFSLLSISNFFLVWLLMELMFLFFLLYVINKEIKSIGLVIYFFFQRVCSLLLFISVVFFMSKLVFLFLLAKLGMFPFFYWVVVVRVKVGIVGNMFILSFQKFSLFWLFWLVREVNFNFLYFIVYLGLFFVVINLLLISDFWLLLVYSSIANTGLILLSTVGSSYIYVVFLYLFVVFIILLFVKETDSYIELLILVMFFLVVPPFVLFIIKFGIIYRIESIMKLAFFLSIFDILILFYYFSLIFIKFILIDVGVLIYMINFLILIFVIMFRNCVAMIIFYKS